MTISIFSSKRPAQQTADLARKLLLSSLRKDVPCAELASRMTRHRELIGPACVLAETVWRFEAENVAALVSAGLTIEQAMEVSSHTRPEGSEPLTPFDREVIRDVALRLSKRVHRTPEPSLFD